VRRAARPEVRPALASAWGALWRSRSLVWAAGIIAVLKAGESTLGIGPHLAHPFGSFGSVLSAPASQWDSGRYLAIAQVGYAIDPSDKAFFPLYPILIRFGAWSQQAALITGVVISIGALAASLYLLYRLVELESDAETARLAVAVVAFFPMSLFFSAVYSDSLFLALSLASFYSARRGWWARAGVAGGLAAATRFVGVLLLAPVALMYVGAIRGRFDRRALFMLLIPAGALAYFVYQAAHGSFLAPLHAEHLYWQRRNVPLLGAVHGVRDFVRSVLQIFGGPGSHHLPTAAGGQLSNPAALAVANITDFAFLVFGCITTVLAARRLAPAYAVYAGASVLMLVSTFPPVEPLASLPRYVAVVFPCEISLALWARGHPRRRATVLLISAGLMALFAGEFATANWVA
jgi:4-amino-4-deoxy-L-arabinose transferase-like glycosyltransferase